MSYLGRGLEQVDNISKLDNITFDGSTTYALTKDSAAFTPISSNAILISIDGVVQQGNFSVSGTNIVFNFSPTSSNTCNWILHMGTGVAFTPADSSVTKDKANFISTSSAAGLQIKGDGTTDGTLQLNCSQNSHGVKIKSPAHSAGQSYTLTLPATAPATDKMLQTNSSGVLSFVDAPGGAFTRVGGSSSTSSTTYIDFDNVFTSTYTQYLITIACQFINNDSHLKLRMRAGGSTDSGSGEYGWIVGGRGVSGTSESGIGNGQGNSADDSYQVNQWGASDNNTENIFYQIHVRNPLPSTTSNAEGNNVMFQNTCTLWTSDNYMTIQHGGGRKTGGTDNDGIRFYLTSGNFRTYDVDIYGLQGS
jgi:hypothetical protein